MEYSEVEKIKSFKLADLLEYMPHSVVAKTLCRNPAGRVVVVASDAARAQPESISDFDTLIQLIDGAAEIVIDSCSYFLSPGDCIVIPAKARSMIKANQRFKMVTTIINSSADDTHPFDKHFDFVNL